MTIERAKVRHYLPEKMIDRLWYDESYFRDILKLKKNSNHSNFPKCDQWVSNDGLNLEFALAGYSNYDIEVSAKSGNILFLRSLKSGSEGDDKHLARMQKGLLTRGIARRNFSLGLRVDEDFDTKSMSATMVDGLLSIVIPRSPPYEILVKVGNGAEK